MGGELLFWVLAVLLVGAALLVVFLPNVVHGAMALVAALFLTAVLFLTLQAPMVGVLQVLVYAGAVMVLFLFVIMFLSPRALEPRQSIARAAGLVGAALLAVVLAALLLDRSLATAPQPLSDPFGSPRELAKSLFHDFVLPFEIASVLLLVAIVGAVVLAKRED
ncbi:MAG TPA: NADH-quinone oxidoreductase subunit J [candidate division Zixibacteria bacterium]|nr:NADH-quinone oxidoreductase subunit J [candidate division Zixibacteria bacterium]